MSRPLEVLSQRIRQQLRAEPVDLISTPERAEELIRAELSSDFSYGAADHEATDLAELYQQGRAEVLGFGSLQTLFDDPTIEEIWINAPNRIFIARSGKSELTDLVLHPEELENLVERLLNQAGARLDLTTPFADGRLADGSRLHVVHQSITGAELSVNIRKFLPNLTELSDLVELKTLTAQLADFLSYAMALGKNVLISGPTHSGKTTLLRALLRQCRPEERVITVEETLELLPDSKDAVTLQCRQPSLEGKGEITLRQLVKESLRMRPDRIVVGEVRGAESLDLLIALNSGVAGVSTIHANSCSDAIRKLCTLPLLAAENIDSKFVTPTVSNCIDLVLQLKINPDGSRELVELALPIIESDLVENRENWPRVVEAVPGISLMQLELDSPEFTQANLPEKFSWVGQYVKNLASMANPVSGVK